MLPKETLELTNSKLTVNHKTYKLQNTDFCSYRNRRIKERLACNIDFCNRRNINFKMMRSKTAMADECACNGHVNTVPGRHGR